MQCAAGKTLRFHDYRLESGVDLLFRGADLVPLERRAAEVLRYLAEHSDRVVPKEELLREIWSDVFTTDGVLKKAISRIRRALGDDPDRSQFIATFHCRGYRFVANVTWCDPRPSAAPRVSSSGARCSSDILASLLHYAARRTSRAIRSSSQRGL